MCECSFIHGRASSYFYRTENVQKKAFLCTKYAETNNWYRSALPVHQMNYDKRQRQHFWFSFTNLAVRHSMFRSGWLLFRVKKGWLGTRGNIPDWHRVRKATFFHPMHKPGIIRHLLSYLMTRIVCFFFVGIQRITYHRLIISEWLICRLCRLSTMGKALTFWF